MKKFLAYIYKERLSIIEKATTIKTLESDITVLFSGFLLNNVTELSEAEYIEKLYRDEGIEFLNRLEGNFALALYDKKHKKLYIAKDRVGVTPLYFSHTEKGFIFGTRVQEFSMVNDFKLTINPNALGHYLQYGYILQPNSIFSNCYKLNAGEYLTLDIKNDVITHHSYWSLENCYKKKEFSTEEHTIHKANELLNQSVEKNCYKKPFGVSLSGGYDSSTLAAIAQRQSSQKIDTFTIGFYENRINEAPYAKAIAKHLGTNHHEHYFSAKDILNFIPKIAKVYDEPFADHASSPTILTSQLLKENHNENLIAGDGGDEVFATAENVQDFEKLKATPLLLKQLFAQPLSYLPIGKIPYLKNYNNLPLKYHKIIELLLSKSTPKMIQNRISLFLEEEIESSVKGYQTPLYTTFDTLNFGGDTQMVDEIIGTYFKTTMVDGELVKSYSAMNYNNIRLSTPYLDRELIEYMAKVPSSIKIKNGTKKYILKEIANRYIPKELIERPKCGFDIPFGEWMRDELKDILYAQINKKRLDKDNLFYTSYILNIRDNFYAGNDAYKYKLWRVFIFQLWYENFCSNKG